MKERLIYFLFEKWVDFGHRMFGWPYIVIYSPKDNVMGITFTKSEKYADKINELN